MRQPRRILVANRGEVAVRIIDAAATMGIGTHAVHAVDDAESLHVRRADGATELPGSGPAAYLDGERIVAAALEADCDAVHPGWGFLSENPGFARACDAAGLMFIGPGPTVLETLGDKAAARAAATAAGLPVARGTDGAADLTAVRDLLRASPAGIMIKALAGGGGRGMRVVSDPAGLEDAYDRCRSEARSAFGDDRVYAEQILTDHRHIEVQIAGDRQGNVHSLGDRDCSVQRQHQKLLEIAPAPGLSDDLRDALAQAAQSLGKSLGYTGLGTVEFLVGPDGSFAFMEANPRLQVEHTVTEETLGIDLVAVQIRLVAGTSAEELGLTDVSARGVAVQARVNSETMLASGIAKPAHGTLAVFSMPHGRGIRVDTHGFAGYTVNPRYDSLLAKVIVHSDDADLTAALRRTARALSDVRTDGVSTNVGFLLSILARTETMASPLTTTFVDEHVAEIVATIPPADEAPTSVAAEDRIRVEATVPEGHEAVRAPMLGTVIALPVAPGETVAAGSTLMVIEAMKMEHQVAAPVSGVLGAFTVGIGDAIDEDQLVVSIEPAEHQVRSEETDVQLDLDAIRPDLARVLERQEQTQDTSRPRAVERRRARGRRTARENIAELCAPTGISEYGSLAVAAQRSRRSMEELIEQTPADGLVSGIGHVNADLFGEDATGCVVMSYDYTVLAGTQGYQNHRKKDRLFEIAERRRLPVVVFAEGGGGRPGDTDNPGIANLDCRAFALFSKLSGLVPTVGVVTGNCFAGNAALISGCDAIIATPEANIGMAGPAMIEGGGLGVFAPSDIGPVSVQAPNGVIDILATDDEDAVARTRQYLAYFQGTLDTFEAPDQRTLRHAVPPNRRQVYDVRSVIDVLADVDSVLELRAAFGIGIITSLIRIEGRAVGLIANNPQHLGGAIDADAADKASRFMELCDAFDLPLVSLCDTPGFMVGPKAEETAQVRHFGRMFVSGASLTVPMVTVVLRKAYGLGAQAMAEGGFFEPELTLSWPTGEFGGMGLEGAVKLGYKRELDAVEDPEERERLYERLVADMYERGSALSVATGFEVDDVIDPATTRDRILSVLRATDQPRRTERKRPLVPAW